MLFNYGWDVKLVKYEMRNQHHDGGGKPLLSLTGFPLLYTQPRDSTELEKGGSLEKANASQKCGFLAIDSNNRIHDMRFSQHYMPNNIFKKLMRMENNFRAVRAIKRFVPLGRSAEEFRSIVWVLR